MVTCVCRPCSEVKIVSVKQKLENETVSVCCFKLSVPEFVMFKTFRSSRTKCTSLVNAYGRVPSSSEVSLTAPLFRLQKEEMDLGLR